MATFMCHPRASVGSDQTGRHVSVRRIHLPPSGASCDVGEGAWSDDERDVCDVYVYLKDANHPDPLRALTG